MQSFEIIHWGLRIKVVPNGPGFSLFHCDELVTMVLKVSTGGNDRWTSSNLDLTDANLLGAIITAHLLKAY